MSKAARPINENLSNEMWRACDILRRDNNVGGVMAYTEHIAWLLFLKFLDLEEKKRAEEAAFKGESYTPVLQGDLAWDAWASPEALQKWNSSRGELVAFVRGRLLPGLASLSGSPLANTIAKLFSDESVGDQTVVRNVPVCASDYNLKEVIDIINQIDFQREDDFFTITRFYEDLLARMGQENQIAGEFHTPRPVIRFMVEVIDPQIGETVYDPACGSAGFLAQAYLHMEKQVRTVEQEETLQQSTFYGQEKKGLAALLGTMNLVLHGVTTPNIYRRNTLEEDVRTSVPERYDIILTNPPFGGKEGAHIQNNFTVKNNATELLFLQHVLKKLNNTPNARAAMVVPEGTLFRGGAFAEVKKTLLEDFHLFAVVSLPPGVFSPYSDVKTALLFFQRVDHILAKNPLARDEVWYYELPLPEGLKKFSKGSPIADEHFAEARALWREWKAYLQGQRERPFAFADEIRQQWQAYRDWQTYREALEKGENVQPPACPAEAGPAYRRAFEAQGPRPQPPYTVWVERLSDLRAHGYDLSPRNPHQSERVALPRPAELTASLLERQRELAALLERLHALVSNGEEE
ncbi:MAG: class I SAM-dependent DNA methyltransferase [Chloroflexota bacterium]